MEPVTLEDEEESGEAHELREIEPNTWSNGHLRFDYYSPRRWHMRYASAPRTGKVLGVIRKNIVWKEYVFTPGIGLVFAHDCLDDIAKLLRILDSRR